MKTYFKRIKTIASAVAFTSLAGLALAGGTMSNASPKTSK